MNLSVLVPFTASKMKQALKAHSSSHFTLYLISWVALQTPLTILSGTDDHGAQTFIYRADTYN